MYLTRWKCFYLANFGNKWVLYFAITILLKTIIHKLVCHNKPSYNNSVSRLREVFRWRRLMYPPRVLPLHEYVYNVSPQVPLICLCGPSYFGSHPGLKKKTKEEEKGKREKRKEREKYKRGREKKRKCNLKSEITKRRKSKMLASQAISYKWCCDS